jgi:hypothetical protein
VLNGLWLGLSLLMLPANASGRREVAASPRLFGLFRVNPVAGDWIPSNSVPGFSPYPERAAGFWRSNRGPHSTNAEDPQNQRDTLKIFTCLVPRASFKPERRIAAAFGLQPPPERIKRAKRTQFTPLFSTNLRHRLAYFLR